MPTRQVLFGLALLGAAGTGWTDDSMFNVAAGRSGPTGTGSGAQAGDAVPPLGNPAALAVLSARPAGHGAWPAPVGFGLDFGHSANKAAGGDAGAPMPGGLLVGQGLGERASVGFGLYEGFAPPMAGGTDLTRSYLSPEPALTGLSAQPTFAYQISDSLSIGVGPRFVHGAVVGGAAPGSDPADAPPAYRDSDTSAGLNLGLLYQLGESTWLGLAYASRYELDLDERSGVANPLVNLAQGRPETNRLVADLRAPSTVTASISHRLDSGWMLSASVGWLGWSGLERAAGEAQAIGAVTAGGAERQYRDTWRLALGAEQQLSERLRWNMGVSYDSSPLAGNERNLDDPMPENLRLAAGLSYQMDEGVELQLGYSLIWLGESQAWQNNRTRTDSVLSVEPPSSTLHVIGGGVVWRF
ncbi:OmpP1/FadL family transporter [Azotobacter armeniacus]